MQNTNTVKAIEIEGLCNAMAKSYNISFQKAFGFLSEEQQAIYDEYLTRQYKNKLNTLFGNNWAQKATPVMLYATSLKNYKKHMYSL